MRVHLQPYVLTGEPELVEQLCVLLGREDVPSTGSSRRGAVECVEERLFLGDLSATTCDAWSAFVGICTASWPSSVERVAPSREHAPRDRGPTATRRSR